jgi:hypothetical protein
MWTRGSVVLAASRLSRRVRTNAADGLARLLLVRDPVADVLDIVENEAALFSCVAGPSVEQRGAAAFAPTNR